MPPQITAFPVRRHFKVGEIIDRLCHLSSRSNPAFARGGRLRRVLEIGLAAAFMYYEERFIGREHPTVLGRLRDVFQEALNIVCPDHTNSLFFGATLCENSSARIIFP